MPSGMNQRNYPQEQTKQKMIDNMINSMNRNDEAEKHGTADKNMQLDEAKAPSKALDSTDKKKKTHVETHTDQTKLSKTKQMETKQRKQRN